MTATKNATIPIKVRPVTRKKYEKVGKITRLKFVEVADLAIDALIDKEPRLQSLRTPANASR